jgi:hypothetical protein
LLAAGAASGQAAPQPQPPEIERASAESASVRVQGDALYDTGNLSKSGSTVLDAALGGVPRGQLTRLVISSGAGDTMADRHIDAWVRNKALVVEVDFICFSSRANYAFPAGRAGVIRADAFVGWHGNERQFKVLAARKGRRLSEALSRYGSGDLAPERRAALVQEFLQAMPVTRQAEADFYASLSLSDAFAVCAICAVGDALGRFAGRHGAPGPEGRRPPRRRLLRTRLHALAAAPRAPGRRRLPGAAEMNPDTTRGSPCDA